MRRSEHRKMLLPFGSVNLWEDDHGHRTVPAARLPS
uniref:Uncharacterized protein n=1 Tax=Arundo donax TaxID=35708 RepID=A0A0A8ZGL5_ARUDO